MRSALVIIGLVCCLVGAQFLLVDKIVLHPGWFPPADPEAQFYEIDDSSQRHFDLPDSGGYALVVMGVACLLFVLALKRQKDH
jgi:hypothetical protein